MAKMNENAVSMEEFQTNTNAWQDLMVSQGGQIDNAILAKVFNVPMVDLQQLVSEMLLADAAVSVDAFLGLSPISSDASLKEMRLYFVGVDAQGEHIYARETRSGDMESAIYDMVLPCPPTCR